MIKCVCGKPLKYIRDNDGCGDLRCINCIRTSGYCSNYAEAKREFERLYPQELLKEAE